MGLNQTEVKLDFFVPDDCTKGQIKPKADWCAVDSPKKQTNEFVLFAVKSKKANKTNSFVHFLWESMAHQSAFGFIWPLVISKYMDIFHPKFGEK